MRRLRALGDAASTRVDAREALVRHSENAVKGGACLSPPRLGRYNRHVDPTRPRKRSERSIGASEKSDDDESHNVDGAALGKTLGTTDEDGLSRLQLGGGDDAQTRRKTTPRRARGEIVFRTRATKPTNHRSTRGETSRRVSRRACLRGRARCGSARRRLSRFRLVAHAAAVVTSGADVSLSSSRAHIAVATDPSGVSGGDDDRSSSRNARARSFACSTDPSRSDASDAKTSKHRDCSTSASP